MATSVRSTPQRSAFAAAFLSFVFPGLGHAYAGARRRAVLFALLPLAVLAGLAIQLGRYGPIGFGLWVGQTSVLGPLAVFNVAILAYRVIATVDAYVIALNTDPDPLDSRGWSRFTPRLSPFSLGGLAAVLAVMAAGHVLAGYWDLRFLNGLAAIHNPVVIAAEAPGPASSPNPTPTLAPQATFVAQPTPKPWNGQGRLNILLVGVDEQDGGFRTDTMIVASIDPTTHKVALFSMPRDTMYLPMPPDSALSALWGPTFGYKLNALWVYSDRYRTVFPDGGVDAIKQALSYAFFGRTDAISYYVLVNFSGFETIVDTLGGVTIDVPAPVVDDGYPGNGNGDHLRVYIPAGIQHMDGSEALTYSRSRKASGYYDDYNRSARQEQILVALEQQADLATVSSHLGDLIDALSSTIHTDIPEGPAVLGALVDQAGYVNLTNIKTYAFSPTGYGYSGLFGPADSQVYGFVPYLARIQATVAAVTSSAGDLAPPAVLAEGAPIVVESGSADAQRTADLVAYLQSLGLNVQLGQAQAATDSTQLLVVNGADASYPQTLALLEQTLGLSAPAYLTGSTAVQAVSEAGQGTGYVIVVGSNTPALTPPG